MGYTPSQGKALGRSDHSHKPCALKNVIGRNRIRATILLQTLNLKGNRGVCNIEVSKMQQL
jgi:hypothetical protein